jgi:hypothetical protein
MSASRYRKRLGDESEKTSKRINYHGQQYFEGDAVRALAATPPDTMAFADLDEIRVVSDEVAKWKSERDNFSYNLTAANLSHPRFSHYCETSICAVLATVMLTADMKGTFN